MGLSGARSPERDNLMADDTSSMAAFWPKITAFSSVSTFFSATLSSVDTACTGTRAIFATMRSTSATVTVRAP